MTPRLHHAGSSYYSMIARLSLVEAGIPFESVFVDIHRRLGQLDPAYVRLNPNMTVPALELETRVLSESRDILIHAFESKGQPAPPAALAWIDRQYTFPIEELTFARLLARSAFARWMVPRTLGKTEKTLLSLADAHPDLAGLYRKRAEVFAHRKRTFDPHGVRAVYADRKREALGHLDALEAELSDGRATLVPSGYGPADVVWTVFLARMHFIKLADEIDQRPALARYASSMFARPSFRAADVWTRVNVVRVIKQLF